MDGSPVCRALRELGYEGALRREAFDWLASMPNARVRGVVEWLASLGPDCSVVRQMTPVQRKTYQELQARGHVLRGEGLREAWERLTSASALLSADELRAELERARQDVSELERRLKKSVQRRNAVMRAKGGEQERATLEVRVRRQEAHQELDRAHAGADSAVDRLEEEMVALTTRCDAAVQSFTASNASEHLHARLVTSGHARYDAADQKGLHALAAFVDRQFDAVRGPMRRLQADEGLRAVDGDPATLPATPQPALLAERGSEGAAEQQGGPSAASYQLQRCHRLLRAVRGVAARAAEAGASARALRARAEAATTLCAQRRRRLAELSLLDDVTVKQHIRDEEEAAEAAERREAAALDRVQALARQRGETEGGDVLVGDYKSKRARQQRYLSRQATVLRFVAQQQARHRLMLAAYTAEQHTLAQTQHACTTATRAVHALSAGAHTRARRTAALRRQGQALASAHRHSIDGRDVLARSVAAAASDAAAAVSGGSGGDTPERTGGEGARGETDRNSGGDSGSGGDSAVWAVGETWEGVQERVQALAAQRAPHSHPSSAAQREGAVRRALGATRQLWAESGLDRSGEVRRGRAWTLGRDPALCDALERADSSRKELSVEVSRVLETHAQREEKIRRDPVLMKGLRAMFVHFHMRPERLQREEAALKERIAGAGQS